MLRGLEAELSDTFYSTLVSTLSNVRTGFAELREKFRCIHSTIFAIALYRNYKLVVSYFGSIYLVFFENRHMFVVIDYIYC